MSSSHTWIRNDDLRRIRQDAARTQRAEAETARIRSEAQARERRINEQHQANLNSLNRTIQQMGQNNTREMDRLRTETRTALGTQAANFRAQLERERESARAEMRAERARTASEISRINSRIDRTDAAVASVRRVTDAISTRVDSMDREYDRRFNEIAQRESDNRERASMHLAILSELLNSISTLKPNKFTDGELYANLLALQNNIRQNIENGQYDAALALAQGSILDAQRLLTRLTILNDEFNERLRTVRALQNQIRETIEGFGEAADNVITYTDANDVEYVQEYDIDEWSGGMFSGIVSRFEAISARLDGAEDATDIDLEELERINCSLEHVTESIEECDRIAQDAVIGSYAVEETSHTIFDVMRSEGYTASESTFADNDEKKPFVQSFVDGNGNTVSIVVANGENPEQAVIALETYNEGAEPDEFVRRTAREGIYSALRERGIEIEDVEHRDDCDKNPTSDAFIANSVAEYAEANSARRQQDAERVVQSI